MLAVVFSKIPEVEGSLLLSNRASKASTPPLVFPKEAACIVLSGLVSDGVISKSEAAAIASSLALFRGDSLDSLSLAAISPSPAFWKLLGVLGAFTNELKGELYRMVVSLPNTSLSGILAHNAFLNRDYSALVVDSAELIGGEMLAITASLCEALGVSLYLVFRSLRGVTHAPFFDRVDLNASLVSGAVIKRLGLTRDLSTEAAKCLGVVRVRLDRRGNVSILVPYTGKDAVEVELPRPLRGDVLAAAFPGKAKPVRGLLEEIMLSGGSVEERGAIEWLESLGLDVADYVALVRFGFLERVRAGSVRVSLTDKGLYSLSYSAEGDYEGSVLGRR